METTLMMMARLQEASNEFQLAHAKMQQFCNELSAHLNGTRPLQSVNEQQQIHPPPPPPPQLLGSIRQTLAPQQDQAPQPQQSQMTPFNHLYPSFATPCHRSAYPSLATPSLSMATITSSIRETRDNNSTTSTTTHTASMAATIAGLQSEINFDLDADFDAILEQSNNDDVEVAIQNEELSDGLIFDIEQHSTTTTTNEMYVSVPTEVEIIDNANVTSPKNLIFMEKDLIEISNQQEMIYPNPTVYASTTTIESDINNHTDSSPSQSPSRKSKKRRRDSLPTMDDHVDRHADKLLKGCSKKGSSASPQQQSTIDLSAIHSSGVVESSPEPLLNSQTTDRAMRAETMGTLATKEFDPTSIDRIEQRSIVAIITERKVDVRMNAHCREQLVRHSISGESLIVWSLSSSRNDHVLFRPADIPKGFLFFIVNDIGHIEGDLTYFNNNEPMPIKSVPILVNHKGNVCKNSTILITPISRSIYIYPNPREDVTKYFGTRNFFIEMKRTNELKSLCVTRQALQSLVITGEYLFEVVASKNGSSQGNVNCLEIAVPQLFKYNLAAGRRIKSPQLAMYK